MAELPSINLESFRLLAPGSILIGAGLIATGVYRGSWDLLAGFDLEWLVVAFLLAFILGFLADEGARGWTLNLAFMKGHGAAENGQLLMVAPKGYDEQEAEGPDDTEPETPSSGHAEVQNRAERKTEEEERVEEEALQRIERLSRGLRERVLLGFNWLTGRNYKQHHLDEDVHLRWSVFHVCHAHVQNHGAGGRVHEVDLELRTFRATMFAIVLGLAVVLSTFILVGVNDKQAIFTSERWAAFAGAMAVLCVVIGMWPAVTRRHRELSMRFALSVYETFLAVGHHRKEE